MVKPRLKYATPRVLPLGYRYSAERKVEVDPVTGPLVREVFQRVAAGKSLRQTLVVARAKGLVGGRGRELRLSTLGYMLRNPFYENQGSLVDAKTFAKAQAKLWEKRK